MSSVIDVEVDRSGRSTHRGSRRLLGRLPPERAAAGSGELADDQVVGVLDRCKRPRVRTFRDTCRLLDSRPDGWRGAGPETAVTVEALPRQPFLRCGVNTPIARECRDHVQSTPRCSLVSIGPENGFYPAAILHRERTRELSEWANTVNGERTWRTALVVSSLITS